MDPNGRQEDGHDMGLRSRFEAVLVACRLAVVVPVVVCALGALGAFAYGTDVFVLALRAVVAAPLPVGEKIGQILLGIDLFLIGATLLIASVGFYELFVARIGGPAGERLPGWLQMRDLNDLKVRVVSMIVLIVAVDFVQVLVEATSSAHVLEQGAAVALVVVSLTAFVRLGQGHDNP
ncbi:MAG: YqhA family protein [Actinomycetota bacterium]|nr:YqhA family protein [Actinomycetota bacterium]